MVKHLIRWVVCLCLCATGIGSAYGEGTSTVFYESFNNCSGNGGNDGTFSPNGATSTIMYDNSGWSASNSAAYGASKCARVGSGSKKGTLTTPTLSYTGSSELRLTFKAAPWNNETAKMTITLSSGYIYQNTGESSTAKNITLSAMTTGKWNEYTLYLSGVSETTKISFSASQNRFFLDEVKVEDVASTPDNRQLVNLTEFTATKTTLTKGETTTTTVDNNQSGWTANYTYSSDKESVATVDGNGVITAVAKGQATITVTAVVDAKDTVYKAGETLTKSIAIEVVNPKHTVTFMANGQSVSNEAMEEGATITFNDLDAQRVPEGQTFMGWAAAAIVGKQENAPALVKSATVGTTDVTYYAVFATASASGNANWVKKKVSEVVANPEAGDYALINSNNKAFNGTLSGGDGGLTTSEFSFSQTEPKEPTDACILSISATTNGIEIKVKGEEKYLYISEAKRGRIAFSTSPDSYWTIDKSNNLSYAKNNAIIRGLSDSFRSYAEGGTNGAVVAFAYRSGVTYTNYCTTVGGADTREFVKFTAWNTNNGETTLEKGNTLATVATLNPAECTTGTITYTSNNPEVATIAADGVITTVGKGEATLVATLSIAEDDAKYRLSQENTQTLTINVVNPERTVTFAIDGETDSKNVREEEAIVFPTVSAPAGLVFVGWTDKDFKGMDAVAPTLVDTTAVVMGEYDLTFVAVYARVAQKGEIKQYELTADMIKEHFAISDYKVEQVWTDESENVKWIACAVTSQGGADSFLQIKNGSGYIGFETPYAIKNVSFYLTNGSNTEIENSFNILTDKDDTKTEFMYVNAGPNASIDIEGNHNQLYITANGTNASRIRNIVLTCQDADRYLGYVTDTEAANTKRTYDVTVADSGYTTVCLPYNAVAPEGAKFFALKSVDNAGLHFVSTDTLAAGQGYVLQGEKGVQYTLTEVTEAVVYNANLLKGVVEQTNLVDLGFTGEDGNNYNYPWILAKDGTFKRYTGTYIPAGKAYLDGALLQNLGGSGAATMRVIFEEATNGQETGLSQLSDQSGNNACYYNLQGQRIAQPTQAGVLYIEQGGRKLILRK